MEKINILDIFERYTNHEKTIPTSQCHTLSVHDTLTACKYISKTNLVRKKKKTWQSLNIYQLLKTIKWTNKKKKSIQINRTLLLLSCWAGQFNLKKSVAGLEKTCSLELVCKEV